MTCEEIVCSDDKTKCEITQTARGTRADCVVSIPDNCGEKECDEGMVCEVRSRGRDGVQVARCVPDKTNPNNPRRAGATCAEVECSDDEVCLMLSDDNGAGCAKPPPPTDCSQLECAEGMDCLPTGNKKRVRCVLRKGQ